MISSSVYTDGLPVLLGRPFVFAGLTKIVHTVNASLAKRYIRRDLALTTFDRLGPLLYGFVRLLVIMSLTPRCPGGSGIHSVTVARRLQDRGGRVQLTREILLLQVLEVAVERKMFEDIHVPNVQGRRLVWREEDLVSQAHSRGGRG